MNLNRATKLTTSTLLGIVIWATTSYSVSAQTHNCGLETESLSELALNAEVHEFFSGSVIVACKGQPVFIFNKGYQNRSIEVLNSDATAYSVGSVGKMITASAVEELVHRKLISFDDPVTSLLPSLQSRLPVSVTVDHLLMHQSGIERIDVPDSALEIVRNNHENYILLHASNVTSAGPTEFAYRNENFIILGEIVEQFSGVLYEDFILSNIVEPLRMVGPTFPLDDRRHKVAVPYLNVDFDTWWNSETEIPPTAFDEFHHVAPVYKPTAAGGLLLTAVDMVKFLQWIAHDERDDVSRISELCLSSALQRGYIRGCSLRSNEDVTRVGHNGSTAGVHARAYHYVERDIDIVVLSNHDGQASSIFRSLEAVILDQKTNK